jgi:NodT family efflux transporter outer membrane factor (OMF) lipoprotein
LLVAGLGCGCTSLTEYVHNHFKVGPNYGRPPAPVAEDWIDARDLRRVPGDISKWWTVFHDPALDSLIGLASRQNLTLRQAGFRVLEARAQLFSAIGALGPQTQVMNGDYTRNAFSIKTGATQFSTSRKRWYGQWDYGFNLGWELDLWGRLRRAIEAGSATLNATVEDYDSVLVTLLGDVATNYVQRRTFERRIQYARQNVELQRKTLTLVEGRLKAGALGTTKVDVFQARSTLEQTEAQIPELEISLRQTNNRLCILLGIPPKDLAALLGTAPIPAAPAEVVIGIPPDLLRRRPDVRRAERLAAAQCAVIGIAEAEFLPHLGINGTFGWSAAHINDLFREEAFRSVIGPSFQWNILNSGRILSNVRLQQGRFQELVAAYQTAVLNAAEDVENGLVTFLKAQLRTRSQAASVADTEEAVRIATAQYSQGTTDLTRVTLLQQNLVQQQDVLAQAQGEIATGLIQVYRALGGGWEIRLQHGEPPPPPRPVMPTAPEETAPPPRRVGQASKPVDEVPVVRMHLRRH